MRDDADYGSFVGYVLEHAAPKHYALITQESFAVKSLDSPVSEITVPDQRVS